MYDIGHKDKGVWYIGGSDASPGGPPDRESLPLLPTLSPQSLPGLQTWSTALTTSTRLVLDILVLHVLHQGVTLKCTWFPLPDVQSWYGKQSSVCHVGRGDRGKGTEA